MSNINAMENESDPVVKEVRKYISILFNFRLILGYIFKLYFIYNCNLIVIFYYYNK